MMEKHAELKEDEVDRTIHCFDQTYLMAKFGDLNDFEQVQQSIHDLKRTTESRDFYANNSIRMHSEGPASTKSVQDFDKGTSAQLHASCASSVWSLASALLKSPSSAVLRR